MNRLALFVLLSLACCPPASAGPGKEIVREMTFGQLGTEDGEFKAPVALALTAQKEIYVADWKKDTVSRFNQFGKFFGRVGPAKGTLEGPIALAVDPRGNLFVVENRKNQVRKFDPSGRELAIIGKTGSATGYFGGPRGIACDSRGHIYVADYYNSRIQELDNDGRYVKTLNYQPPGGPPVQPRGVGVDGRDRVFGIYSSVCKIVRFNAAGEPDLAFGAQGKGPGLLADPRYIAFDIRDNIYVSDYKNNRVHKYNDQGVTVGSFGGRGSSTGQFNSPQGVAVDPEGNIYVADTDNYRVQILVVNDFRRNLNLGLFFYRTQDFARSAFHYEEVLRADPLNKEASESLVTSYRTLSDAALALKDVPNAKKYLANILKLKPFDGDARKKLRSLVWEENRSDVYYPTVTLGIVLALVFLGSVFFRYVRT